MSALDGKKVVYKRETYLGHNHGLHDFKDGMELLKGCGDSPQMAPLKQEDITTHGSHTRNLDSETLAGINNDNSQRVRIYASYQHAVFPPLAAVSLPPSHRQPVSLADIA